MGTKLGFNTKVTGIQNVGSRTVVSLANGEPLTDVYLPLVGTKVNTAFVPGELLVAAETSNWIIRCALLVRRMGAIGDVANLNSKQESHRAPGLDPCHEPGRGTVGQQHIQELQTCQQASAICDFGQVDRYGADGLMESLWFYGLLDKR